jgi:predicted nucleic acid-binding protein
LEQYDFLRKNPKVQLFRFSTEDETDALDIVSRYDDHRIGFHDALCAAAAKRLGVVKIFTFDPDFAVLGFLLLPGELA